MFGLSLETCTSNLKSVAYLTVLELLAFNAQKFRGSRYHGHMVTPHFEKFLRGHVRRNMHIKFKVRSFNHFGAISISAHPMKQYLCHSVCSLGGDNYV